MIDLNYLYHDKRAVLKRYKYASIEAKMLRYLKDYINVPEVYEYQNDYLIIKHLPSNCSFCEESFAKELANLHQNSWDGFGFFYDTTIGPFLQPNKKYNNWIEFFVNERVLYMAKKAMHERQIDVDIMKKIEKFCIKIEDILPKDIKPSLLHGDIWSGNLICHNQKNYLIDPAIYYGHSEIELAFIMMFNTFGERFFKSYSEVLPIDKEFFKSRYLIYQLYPYLVHVRIYGKSYLDGVRRILGYF